jgi:hypothetical protein
MYDAPLMMMMMMMMTRIPCFFPHKFRTFPAHILLEINSNLLE